MGYNTELVDLAAPGYTPGKLLDAVLIGTKARSDAELARIMNIDQATLSRLRSKSVPLTPFHFVRIMDVLPDLRLREIRALCGVEPNIYPLEAKR